MYTPSNLISQPPGEFSVIFEDEGTFVFDKRFADGERELVLAFVQLPGSIFDELNRLVGGGRQL